MNKIENALNHDTLLNTFTAMRYLSADLVFPIYIPPVPKGVVIVDDHGKIIDLLVPGKDEIPSSLPVERFNGILCPGFINAHCHLELSHLKGKISQGKGLPEFVNEMVQKRDGDSKEILQAMIDADAEMYSAGIVAVGDISNSTVSCDVKKKSKIYYHTFVELFDIFPDKADMVFSNGLITQKKFSENGLQTSIVPHAHYTVSNKLMKVIFEYAQKSGSFICIHNQECSSENEMYQNGTGLLIDKLQKLTGAYSEWKPFRQSSLSVFINQLNSFIPVQLVHNTFTDLQDIRMTIQKSSKTFWCMCVNANLYIENTTPHLPDFIKEKCVLTVGTDSYASNTSLSILYELITIHKKFPQIGLSEILSWATINGAEFLGLSKKLGSFEKGKTPGINFISDVELTQLHLNSGCRVKRLV